MIPNNKRRVRDLNNYTMNLQEYFAPLYSECDKVEIKNETKVGKTEFLHPSELWRIFPEWSTDQEINVLGLSENILMIDCLHDINDVESVYISMEIYINESTDMLSICEFNTWEDVIPNLQNTRTYIGLSFSDDEVNKNRLVSFMYRNNTP